VISKAETLPIEAHTALTGLDGEMTKPKNFPEYFYPDRYGLIGHDSADVAKWLAAHPEFSPATGDIWFDYGTGEDQTECTSIFFPEPEDCDPDDGLLIGDLIERVRETM